MRLGLALFPALLALPLAADEPTPVEALKKGGATLELRTRYERVDDKVSAKTADALTNRTVLTWKSGKWNSFGLTAQFENVAVLSGPRFFVPQTGYGLSRHAVVVDQPLSGVNQLFLEWKGLKAGRQLMNLDNQRFIGSVGWRQNDQAFTGLSFSNDTWLSWMGFSVARFTQAHLITGITKPVNADIANVDLKFIPKGHLRLFYYGVEEQAAVGTPLAASTGSSTANSFRHTGARLDGDVWKFFYDLSAAKQDRHKDATLTGTLEADYRSYGVGFRFSANHSLQAAKESLEPGFKTPYATLHAWNGWADRFLATPAKGLVDTSATYKGKAGAFTFEAAYHAFEAETDGAKYGTELDASVGYAPTKWLNLLVKAADYKGDTAAAGAFAKDTRKIWLQTAMKF